VTDVPGTTRDYLEVPLAVAGIPIVLTDTAGLRDSTDAVEAIGVERANMMVDAADVLLWLGDPASAPKHRYLILVHPRTDQPGRETAPETAVATSVVSGEGLGELLERIGTMAKGLLPAEGEIALNRRQAELIEHAYVALTEAAQSKDLVLQAENLRVSRETFDRLTGSAGFEDVLDTLFGRFCLGK